MADFILGVAGHVDHGKTALVRALTGFDTDRLPEEKRRGLTIEPGFAPLPLPGGGTAGLVDVPGHEKFIRNMLLGAAGLDAVLLVIAADDGVMPQTREHLDICRLLGVTQVIVALTKCDLADPDRVAAVAEQAAALTGGAPVIPVSAPTGWGLEALISAIAEVGAGATSAIAEIAPFRLGVDRVFLKDGFGTVVTGTLTEGTVAVGDEVMVYPAGTCARVRGLQSHGAEAARLDRGCRAALNLAGIDRAELRRGDTVAKPGSLTVCGVAGATLTLLPDAPFGVKTGSQLHFYCGSAEVLCRCTLGGQKVLAPGESCQARLRFSAPLAAREGDRFVVRFFSPAVTVGGGVLSDISGEKRRGQASPPQVTVLLAEYHARYPLREGMDRAELLQKAGTLEGAKLRGNAAMLPGFRPKYTPELAKIRDKIEVYYRRRKTQPTENKIADALFDSEVIHKLLRDGVLVPLGKDLRIHRRYWEQLTGES